MSQTEVTRYAESFEGNNDDQTIPDELTYRDSDTIPGNNTATPDPVDTDPRLTYVGRLPRTDPIQNCSTRVVPVFGDSNLRLVVGRNRNRAKLRFFIDPGAVDTVFVSSQAVGGVTSLVPVIPNAYLEFTAIGEFYAQAAVNANLYIIEESY